MRKADGRKSPRGIEVAQTKLVSFRRFFLIEVFILLTVLGFNRSTFSTCVSRLHILQIELQLNFNKKTYIGVLIATAFLVFSLPFFV